MGDKDKKYEKKRTNKTVTFIHKNELDLELLEWANSLEDFSTTVKQILNEKRNLKGEK